MQIHSESVKITLFERSQEDRRSRGKWHQQHHQRQGYPGRTSRTESSCLHHPRKSVKKFIFTDVQYEQGFHFNYASCSPLSHTFFHRVLSFCLCLSKGIWFQNSVHTCLYLSLKAKLRACVGKYLITLAKLPRQYERSPCSLGIRTKQSTIPEKTTIF